MVKRTVDPALVSELSKPFFFPVAMVYFDHPTGAIYAHTGAGNISWNGQTWLGVGEFGAINLPDEAGGTLEREAQIGLVGIPAELDDDIDVEVRGSECEVYFGALIERNGNVLAGDPILAYRGFADAKRDELQFGVGEEGESLTRSIVITLTGNPPQRSSAAVYHTNEDQKGVYPSDTAGRFAQSAKANVLVITWPS